MPTILLVGFEDGIATTLDDELRREGFNLLAAESHDDAFAYLAIRRPSLALIQVHPSDPSGLVACKELRARSLMPVILVSNQDREADAVAGLDAGADDYVTQPHRSRELVARIRAALRRSPLANPCE